MSLTFDVQREEPSVRAPRWISWLLTGGSSTTEPATPAPLDTTGAPPSQGPGSTPPSAEQQRNKRLLIAAGVGFLVVFVVMVAVFQLLRPQDGTPGASGARSAGASASVDWSKLPPEVTKTPLLWLRADGFSALDAGRPVATWQAQAGPSAEQPDPARQPTLVASRLGTRPAVVFDGVDDFLEVQLNIHPTAHPSITIVCVFDSDEEDKSPLRKLYGSDDGEFDRSAGLDDRAINRRDSLIGKNYVVFGGPEIAGPGTQSTIGYFNLVQGVPYLTVDQFGLGAFNGWVQGVHAVVDAGTTSGEGPSIFYIGGIGPPHVELWDGGLAEMLVFDGRLTESERISLQDFLARKYGIELFS